VRVAVLWASFAITLLIVSGTAFLAGQNSAKTTTVTRYSTITQTSQVSNSSPTSVRCMRTGEGWAFRVHVVADGTGKPIPGAEVKAVSSPKCLPSSTSTMTVTDTSVMVAAMTPSNGTISLPTIVENYSISVTFEGISYTIAQIVVVPVQITDVTVNFPSGNITITHTYPPH
jgi:hypothetical protein